MRTRIEIEQKIIAIVQDDTNFMEDNYGSEAADNGEYEEYYSRYNAQKTLIDFTNWLLQKQIIS